MPIPSRFGRWVSRDGVIAYLEEYVAHHGIEVQTGVAVQRIDREGDEWVLRTSEGDLTSDTVVVATGYNHTPVAPEWPGLESFDGEVIHASRYRNAEPYAGRDVLVVGPGNTGAEIAVDLVEGGARQVWLAVRSAPHIVRRTTAGWPAQGTGILVRRLPAPVVNQLARAMSMASVPDLSEYGLPRPDTGLLTRAREGAIPVQDVGIIAAVQARTVTPVAAVEAVEGGEVLLSDGTRLSPQVIIAATGYSRGLDSLVGHLGVLDERGRPIAHGGSTPWGAPGLYFTGYTNPISGMFRELRIDARKIARAISGHR
jgi:putative flavoprotein involved in K+ transport